MQTILHKNDLSNDVKFSDVIAADCEMMGLQPKRDPLCLIQLYDGTGDCHLVQFIDKKYNSPTYSGSLLRRPGLINYFRPSV